jgi:para-nitrobenzyl esterase
VHTIELPFVFGMLRFTGIAGGAGALARNRAALTGLSAQLVDAWTSFARTGDPSAVRTVARPVWPAYRRPTRATMTFDLPSVVVRAPRDAERATWDAYPFGPFTP